MNVRIATQDDIELVAAAVAATGQQWSLAAVADRLADPWITAISIGDKGQIDGLMLGNWESAKAARIAALYGPADLKAWLVVQFALGQALADEAAKRHPKWNFSQCWVHMTIYPTGCQMSAAKSQIATAHGWTAQTSTSKEGYVTKPDGTYEIYVLQPNLLASAAKTVL